MSSAKTYRIQKYTISVVKESGYTIDRKTITNRNDVQGLCKSFLGDHPLESTCVVALDAGNRVIGFNATDGATNQCAVYPSSVFRFLLSTGAAAFIVAHNHPGGSRQPSRADWQITERLHAAGKLLDVPLIDHLIIADDDAISMRESLNWPK